ncbi:hypothetical protein BCR42DRAFT_413481 [Absidia repens]|uniref:Uncharacterized protein n=1 Tax=Absidia repens TaxID=90262 RepID=A0A1X2IJC7_9FUNG|nr:hypothetical protein BCR42DRAFT_413481 [Absidia repens]
MKLPEINKHNDNSCHHRWETCFRHTNFYILFIHGLSHVITTIFFNIFSVTIAVSC